LGKDNAFVVIDEDVKLPTDLLGTSHATFKCKKRKKGFISRKSDTLLLDKNSLHKNLDGLKRQIEEKTNLGVLGMLPSTVLAIGYFENFVQPVCEYLSANSLEINGTQYDHFKFRIILPINLDSDIKKRAKSFYRNENFESIQLPTTVRNYPLYVMVDTKKNMAILSDMPTTLKSLDKAIEMYLRKGHVVKTTEQRLLEERELRNFTVVLENLLKSDIFCESCVEIELEPH
jgi:hypothetical protein